MKRILAFVLLMTGLAAAQGAQRIAQATTNLDGYVKVISGASVTVCSYPGCSPVSLFQDVGLAVPSSNPVIADANGNYMYYAASGTYIERTFSPGTGTSTRVVTIGAANATGTCEAGGSTAGDLCYFNGAAWVLLGGNESSQKFLAETSGVPSWQNTSAQISAEYLWPVDYTNAPSPTVTNDIVRTLLAQAGSAVFMGPPPFSNPLSAIGEVCQNSLSNSSTLTLTCTFLTPFAPGDGIAVFTDNVCGIACPATFTFADVVTNPLGTFNDSYTVVDYQLNPNTPTADAYTLNMANGGFVVLTATVGGGVFTPYGSWNLIAVHLHNVNALDSHSIAGSTSWASPGSPTNLSSVTTSHANTVILSSAQSWTNPANTMTAGSGSAIPPKGEINTASSSSHQDVLTVEAINKTSTGTYTQTIVGTQAPSGGSAGYSLTMAFVYIGAQNSNPPFFRYPTLNDQVTQGWFPDPTGNNGKFLTTDGNLLSWGSATTSAAGSNTQLQYNNSGAFGGITGVTTDGTSLNIGSGSAAYTHIAGADGSITTYKSDHTTIALPYLAGSLGTDIVCGASTLCIWEASDQVFHEGKASSDLGALLTTSTLPIYNTTGTLQATAHTVIGTCVLGTSCSITLTGASVFTSSGSYVCTAVDNTATAAVKIAQSSGSAFTLTGTGTDTLGFVCSGN